MHYLMVMGSTSHTGLGSCGGECMLVCHKSPALSACGMFHGKILVQVEWCNRVSRRQMIVNQRFWQVDTGNRDSD
jgi:hypothetical protein